MRGPVRARSLRARPGPRTPLGGATRAACRRPREKTTRAYFRKVRTARQVRGRQNHGVPGPALRAVSAARAAPCRKRPQRARHGDPMRGAPLRHPAHSHIAKHLGARIRAGLPALRVLRGAAPRSLSCRSARRPGAPFICGRRAPAPASRGCPLLARSGVAAQRVAAQGRAAAPPGRARFGLPRTNRAASWSVTPLRSIGLQGRGCTPCTKKKDAGTRSACKPTPTPAPRAEMKRSAR